MKKAAKGPPGMVRGKKRLHSRFTGYRSAWGYRAAGLAALVLMATLSYGVAGCSAPFWATGGEGTLGSATPNLRQSPEELARLVQNVRYYTLMGRPDLGLRELEQAHQQDPYNLKILDVLARSYEELGQFDTARQLYQEGWDRHGPHPVLANNFGFTYYQEGRWEEAEKWYRQSLALDSRNEAARNNLGLLYCRLHRPDEARQLWREADGAAVADVKMGQALAALGQADGSAYAQRPDPAPPVAQACPALQPGAAAARKPTPAPSAAASRTQPLISKKIKRGGARLASKPAAAMPLPADPTPKAAPPPPAVVTAKASPIEAAAPSCQAPLTGAELAGAAIEVRNGTWTRNLARQTRTRLQEEGFRVAKIGNHHDFGATKTMVYYRPGAERVARAVSGTFFPHARLEPSAQLQQGTDIKILLGADLVERPPQMARLVDEQP